MCFDLSWNIVFSVFFIQLWFSQIIITMSNSMSNNPDIIFRIYIASQQVKQDAMYSASAVLRETMDCFLINHEIMADPRQ